jgi:hypothetical protein
MMDGPNGEVPYMESASDDVEGLALFKLIIELEQANQP